ncbi:YbhN family protein [Fodinicurvata halophila]|uniref:YbhN family protein n=1 Tax=Fodinicurvata halophila TaxID=1419723 RepID=A0ABV8UK22_9PROT
MSDQDVSAPRKLLVSGRRLLIFSGLFALLTLLGFYAVYDQFAGQKLVFDPQLLAWTTLLSIGGLFILYILSDGLRLYFTLRALGQKVPLGQIFRLVFINIFFSNVTPMATGGGVAQIWYLQRHGVRMGTATAATTIRTVLAVIFIFSLTPIFLLTLEVLHNQALISRISGVLAVLIVLYLGFFAIVLFRSRWLIGPVSRTLRILRRLHLISEERYVRWQYRCRREMLRFSSSFAIYLQGPKLHILLSVFFTFLFLISLFSFPALIIAGLGYHVDYLVTTGLLVVTTFVMYFSPTPGAAGVSEGLFGSFFSGILTPDHLILVILIWRLVTVYIGMLIGLVIMQVEIAPGKKAREKT